MSGSFGDLEIPLLLKGMRKGKSSGVESASRVLTISGLLDAIADESLVTELYTTGPHDEKRMDADGIPCTRHQFLMYS